MFDCFVGTFVFLFQTKYRKKPDSIKFTSVVDSPDLIHAKNSYVHCNEVGVFSSLVPGTRWQVELLSGQCLRTWALIRIDVSANLVSTTWAVLSQ